MSRKKSTTTSSNLVSHFRKCVPNKTDEEVVLSQKPSEVTDAPWIYARRLEGKYPESGKNSGKWLVFVGVNELDRLWADIKLATEAGLLGNFSKVATAMPSASATNAKVKVICIYSYDYVDKDDVMRIRGELRKLGIENKISYKTNNATRQGQYKVNGTKHISTYYE